MALKLELYKHIRQRFIKETTDLFDKTTQKKIEAYDTTIGLDEAILDTIKKYLKEYNKYLETQKAEKVSLRYYQILALYFTEAYFKNRDDKAFNDFSKNALAYWMATGSGKTIIMHLNIFQYLAHNKGFKELELIMTTPGVNLIEQHEREVTPLIEYLNTIHRNKIQFNIDTTSALLNKPDDFFNFPDDKKKLRLILVDEAHIGLGTSQKDDEGEFLKLRRRLNIKHSFLFEYSATFHNLSPNLIREYSQSIVYDYNYNLFYRDGYGKDFYFQKISDDVLRGSIKDNLDKNLSVIEDKLRVFNQLDYALVSDLFQATTFPDRPLIAFMGNTVNDKKQEGKGSDELSDISEIVHYLANLTEEERVKFKNVFNGDFKGKLKLTRNPSADDEILLSYGIGDYWGIINVGNGLNFINDYKGDNVEKLTSTTVVISNIEKYLFENIDKPQSPINILIGSRKFAEGWNCFRVSVIGLINLGKSKGNKIIQIFGRGVRLKGLNNDGKRKDMKHIEDYFALTNSDNDNLKRLETLCVFSLQKSYLETFTEAVNNEIELTVSHEIPVKPSIIKMNGENAGFNDYQNDLQIFKLSKTKIDVKKVLLYPEDRKIEYEYILEGTHKKAAINSFSFNLDYRTDRNTEGVNIRHSLKALNTKFNDFIDYQPFAKTVIEVADEANIQLYVSDAYKKLSFLTINDVLAYIDTILYKEDLPEFDFDFIENINVKLAEEFVKKVRNKINWHLNSSIYEYSEPLKQSKEDIKGDFIEKYTLVKAIPMTYDNGKTTRPKTEAELNKDIEAFTESITDMENALNVGTIQNHIYAPLLKESKHQSVADVKISPDKLNAGELKFVTDFNDYVKAKPEKFIGFDVYLMRNVESLKSIGIYLNDDTEVFYPDFIMWLVSENKVYINFIDPKGQMGTKDFNTDQYREKITIADKVNNPTLPNIEKELKRIHSKEFVLNSFMLLRDSSELGKVAKSDWKIENMISKNVLRLDWHQTDEKGNKTDAAKLVDGKNYLDWIMEKAIM